MSRDFFDLHAAGKNWMYRQYVMRARFAATHVPHARRILDIACGSGYGAYHFARTNPNAEVIGADISGDALEYARLAYQLPNLSFVYGDAFDLQYPTGHFDLVISFETIEHVTEGEAFLDELARVTATEGTFLCSTPHDDYDLPNTQHVRMYLPEELYTLLGERYHQVEELLQFQTNVDRADQLRQRRLRNIKQVPRRALSRVTPEWFKRKLRGDPAALAAQRQPKCFVMNPDEVYAYEQVTSDTARDDGHPHILVAACRRPKR